MRLMEELMMKTTIKKQTRKNPVDQDVDQELATMLCNRTPGFVDRVYQVYGPRLRQVVWPVLHDHSEMEDVVQDVLLHADRKAEQFDSQRGTLFSWLSTLARRRAIDRLRQRMARQRAKDGFQAEQIDQTELRQPESTVERAANTHDLRHLFSRLLEKLPQPQQEVIRMKYYRRMSQREIAQEMNTSASTVRTRIELGMQKLKNSVEALGDSIA